MMGERTQSFLLTDVVGSTRPWNEHPDNMIEVTARHDTLLADHIGGASQPIGRYSRLMQRSIRYL